MKLQTFYFNFFCLGLTNIFPTFHGSLKVFFPQKLVGLWLFTILCGFSTNSTEIILKFTLGVDKKNMINNENKNNRAQAV